LISLSHPYIQPPPQELFTHTLPSDDQTAHSQRPPLLFLSGPFTAQRRTHTASLLPLRPALGSRSLTPWWIASALSSSAHQVLSRCCRPQHRLAYCLASGFRCHDTALKPPSLGNLSSSCMEYLRAAQFRRRQVMSHDDFS
jgi:hypothetical protein